MQSRPIVNPYLAVVVGVLAVSFSALFVRLSSAPALIIATYRLLFTFLLLAPFTLTRLHLLKALDRRQVLLASASGTCLAFHFATWFTSLQYTSVASSTVLVTLQPVFVVLGSWIFFREKVHRLALFGGGIALVGSLVIGASDFKAGGTALLGDGLALLAAMLVSGYLLIGRRLRRDVPLEAYTFVTYGSSTLVLILLSLINQLPFTGYPFKDWLLFFALALVCTVLGHTIFNWVLKYVQASVVSVSVMGEPIGAIIWASIFLREFPNPRQMAGGCLIFTGLYLFTRISARTS
jgi:drug/metabolite transporter (DMT)-like permease